jgi:choline kinase
MMRFIISAAGLGSRLGMEIPKCLLPLGAGCLIDYQLAVLPPDSDVRIVVGFRELEVISHVAKRWKDVTFVRNSAYASTTNSHSLFLATQHLSGPYVTIDGDLLIEKCGFDAFLRRCAEAPKGIVGVVPRGTEEAVGVEIQNGQVVGFCRPGTPEQKLCADEWCGIAFVNGFELTSNRRYVFEELTRHLPLPAFHIPCLEIDTPEDLARMRRELTSGRIQLPTLPPYR